MQHMRSGEFVVSKEFSIQEELKSTAGISAPLGFLLKGDHCLQTA